MPNGKRVNAEKSTAAPVTAAPAPAPRKSKARPKLGQNFLVDRQAAERIVDALGDISQRIVLEIGPGRGALTDSLARRAGRLIAIELDRVLAAQLRMHYANVRNVEVIEADVLAVDFSALLRPRPGALTGLAPQPHVKMQVVGNLPYYITSDILLRLFEFHEHFDHIVIMVQREVADRLVAKPGSSEYGLLSATAQFFARVEKLFVLPPGAFSPSPKVHSAVLRLAIAPQSQQLGVDTEGFMDFLKLSFGQKRKTLVNNLKSRYDLKAIRGALERARLRADVRAEAVSLDKAAAVYKALRS